MLYVIAIHRPYPEKRQFMLESMHRFGAAARTQPGLLELHALSDAESGALVGFAVWDSKEAMMAARPKMREAIKDDPHSEWEPNPPEVFLLEEA